MYLQTINKIEEFQRKKVKTQQIFVGVFVVVVECFFSEKGKKQQHCVCMGPLMMMLVLLSIFLLFSLVCFLLLLSGKRRRCRKYKANFKNFHSRAYKCA